MIATTDAATTTTTAAAMDAIGTMTVARLRHQALAATHTDRRLTRSVITTPVPRVISPLLQTTRNLLRRLSPATGRALRRAISPSELRNLRVFRSRMTLIAPTPGPIDGPDRMDHRINRHTDPNRPTAVVGVVVAAEAPVTSVSRLLRGPC